MRSNNPVFNRSPEFNGQTRNAYGNTTYPGSGSAYPGYGQQPYGQQGYSDPSQWSTGTPGAPVTTERMTIDSVVQKTGISLGIVILTAAATWILTGPLDADNAPKLYGALVLGSGAAFILSLVNSFKRVVSPALVVAFCAAEGVALGALSKFFDSMAPDSGIVMQAVLGTFAAFGGTLAAYKFFDIKVGNKFRTFVIAAMFGMVGLSLLEMVLGLFSSQIGLFGFGAAGLLFAVIGLVLGVFMLILDFDFVEQGVRYGIDQRESWRAAFALTVSLVWIYTNLLRILYILNQD